MHTEKICYGPKLVALVDRRFAGAATAELMSVLGATRLAKVGTDKAINVYLVEGCNPDVQAKNRNNLVFVESLITLETEIAYYGTDYEPIIKYISLRASEAGIGRFNLEVKIFNSHLGETAKSVEVKIGSPLEAAGLPVSMADPETTFYIIFLAAGRGALVCSGRSADTLKLDMARYYKRTEETPISRATYKLLEAFSYFGIADGPSGICLDVGAAPGGWSSIMLRNHWKVVAVDNALLDYESLSSRKVKISVLYRESEGESGIGSACRNGKIEMLSAKNLTMAIGESDLVHIKSNMTAELMCLLASAGKFGFLVMDANVEPIETAKILTELRPLLADNAHVLATLKLPHGKIGTISKAVSNLSTAYCDIRLKKLPHNRREITLCASAALQCKPAQ